MKLFFLLSITCIVMSNAALACSKPKNGGLVTAQNQSTLSSTGAVRFSGATGGFVEVAGRGENIIRPSSVVRGLRNASENGNPGWSSAIGDSGNE